MADRVHPSDDWPSQAEPTSDEAEKEQPKDVVRSEKGLVSSKAVATTTTTTASSFNPKPKPMPGTYIVHIPKDQIYHVPPPENDRLFRSYVRRRPRSDRCRFCCCTAVVLLLFLLLSASLLSAVFYIVARPAPHATPSSPSPPTASTSPTLAPSPRSSPWVSGPTTPTSPSASTTGQEATSRRLTTRWSSRGVHCWFSARGRRT